jgi:hypothetical protein
MEVKRKRSELCNPSRKTSKSISAPKHSHIHLLSSSTKRRGFDFASSLGLTQRRPSV